MSQHSPGEIKAEFTPRYGGPEEFIFLLWIVFCEGGGGGILLFMVFKITIYVYIITLGNVGAYKSAYTRSRP